MLGSFVGLQHVCLSNEFKVRKNERMFVLCCVVLCCVVLCLFVFLQIQLRETLVFPCCLSFS